MDKDLIKKLTESGMNVENTLERFMGNEDLYIKFLKKFLDDKNFEDLKAAIEEGRLEEAFKYAHTLKGLSANLGLDCILEPLVPIVETLRSNRMDNLQENTGKLDENYRAVCRVIRTL